MYSWCSSAVLSSINSSAKVLSTPRSARKSIKWSYRAWKQEQETFLSRAHLGRGCSSNIPWQLAFSPGRSGPPPTGDQTAPIPFVAGLALGGTCAGMWPWRGHPNPVCKPKANMTNELHPGDDPLTLESAGRACQDYTLCLSPLYSTAALGVNGPNSVCKGWYLM